jgi:hypothetical protein
MSVVDASARLASRCSDTPWFFLIWSGPFANAGKVPLSLQFAWHLAGAGPFFSPWRFDRTNIEVFGHLEKQIRMNSHLKHPPGMSSLPNICSEVFLGLCTLSSKKANQRDVVVRCWCHEIQRVRCLTWSRCFDVFCNETDLWWPIQVIWWYCPIGIHLCVIWFTYGDLSSVQTYTDPGGQILMLLPAGSQVFGDRLTDNQDSKWMTSQIKSILDHLGSAGMAQCGICAWRSQHVTSCTNATWKTVSKSTTRGEPSYLVVL